MTFIVIWHNRKNNLIIPTIHFFIVFIFTFIVGPTIVSRASNKGAIFLGE